MVRLCLICEIFVEVGDEASPLSKQLGGVVKVVELHTEESYTHRSFCHKWKS